MSDPTPEQLQAFLEDLVAVCIKHGLMLDTMGGHVIVPLNPEFGTVFIPTNTMGFRALYFANYAPDPGDIVVQIPTTAHGRLSAVARVAALRDEVAS